MMKKKIVLLVFLLSTVLSLCVVGLLNVQVAYASPYTSIDVGTAYSMITNGSYPNLVILDVRTQSEYDSGHICDAVWIPVTELEARIDELASHENHEIIVYCRSGSRSVTASEILDSSNFTKVYNMLGGIQAWESAGYEVWIATVHNINTTFNYDTIQAAIDAPQTLDGHAILVDAGTYYENVVVNKSISLVGENPTNAIIDGNMSGNIISVEADSVIIENFTIRNGNGFGIGIGFVDNCMVKNNNVTANYAGIYISSSSNNTVSANNVTANNNGAIRLSWSSNNILRNNSMTGNPYNFDVYGSTLADYINDIDVSNMIDGKPIYYWVNKNDMIVPIDAGYVALVNCSKIMVQNLKLTNNGQGILVAYTENSTITTNNVTANYDGIRFSSSSNNTIYANHVTANLYGIWFHYSSNNTISTNNVIANDYDGIRLYRSSNNTISANNVATNYAGIGFDSSFNNKIYHNKFIDNKYQVTSPVSVNTWDNDYPSGGNFWSGYSGSDSDNDGIGDNPYIINENNQDNYPLTGMFSVFNATSEYYVQTICNSTISDFQFNSTTISFNVTGEDDTTGFCRICIPTALMNDTYRVFVNGTEIQYTLLPFSNSTHSYLYFTYNHSTQEVMIIPEFPTWTLAFLILILLSFVIVIYKRRILKTPIH